MRGRSVFNFPYAIVVECCCKRARQNAAWTRQVRIISAPFVSVAHKTRRIDGPIAPMFCVIILALRGLTRCEGVPPAKLVPIIDVKRHWNKGSPQALFMSELTQPFFGGRTTAATFAREELDQRNLLHGALESQFTADVAGKSDKNERDENTW